MVKDIAYEREFIYNFVNELKIRNVSVELELKKGNLLIEQFTPDFFLVEHLYKNDILSIIINGQKIVSRTFNYMFQDNCLIITYKNGKVVVIPL
jgi:hypothetical protein